MADKMAGDRQMCGRLSLNAFELRESGGRKAEILASNSGVV